MGASSSMDLRPEEVQELQDLSGFAPREIKSLYNRFRRLDRAGKGTLGSDDLMIIPEIAINPLAPRLVGLFPTDGEGRVNFKAFVTTLAKFAPQATKDVKALATFGLLDVDGDGAVSKADIRALLTLMVGPAGGGLTPTQLDAAVESTLSAADVDGVGVVSLADFLACSGSVAWAAFGIEVESSFKLKAPVSTGEEE